MAPIRSFRRLLVALAILTLAFDLGSKYLVFHWLYNSGKPARDGAYEAWTESTAWNGGTPIYIAGGRFNVVPGWFGLTAEYLPTSKPSDGIIGRLQTLSAPMLPRVNHGALFGLFSDHQDRANAAFAVVSLIAAAVILIWGLRKAHATDRWLCICLGLILGGTLGNLFDRVVFGGVRDFLYFYRIEYPVFNIADCALVIGAAMLALQAAFGSKKENMSPTSAPVDPAMPLTTR